MGDKDSFIRAIMANPEDDAVRLVYADWLDEQNKPDAATKLRQPGKWILFYTDMPLICWVPDNEPSSLYVAAGVVPADVSVECDQCHYTPTLAILSRAFDENRQKRWLCRSCGAYSIAVMHAKHFGHRLLACTACGEEARHCQYCRNFRVLVPGGAPNNFPFEIFEPALRSAKESRRR